MCLSRPGSLDGRAHVHGIAQPGPSTTGSSCACPGPGPVGQDTGLRDILAAVSAIGPERVIRPGRQPGAVSQADVLEHLRGQGTLLRVSPGPSDRSRSSPTRPTAWEVWWSRRCSPDLPFELEILFGELDGTFPNHPADPIQAENLVALQRRILDRGADVGLAFDGDADRCFWSTTRASPLSGSTTTALVAAAMLEKNPGATILHNLICSKAVPEIIRERGGDPRAHPGGALVLSRPSWPTPTPSLGASIPVTTTSGTTTGPTPARSRPWSSWRSFPKRTAHCPPCERTSSVTPIRVRSTPRWATRLR